MLKLLKSLLNDPNIELIQLWKEKDVAAKFQYNVVLCHENGEDFVGHGPTLEKALARAADDMEEEEVSVE